LKQLSSRNGAVQLICSPSGQERIVWLLRLVLAINAIFVCF